MTDYTELKRLAENSLGDWYESGELRYEDRSGYTCGLHHDDEYFIAAANPSAVLALIAENEKIRGLLAEKLIGQTMLTGIIPEDGGMTIGLEGGACAIMADVFGEQLFTSQAENYIELSFASGRYPDLGQIVVTVKRETGKTPHQLRVTAEQERDQLKADNESLRKDADRYRWLGDNPQVFVSTYSGKWRVSIGDSTVTDWHESRAEAIDAAIRYMQ